MTNNYTVQKTDTPNMCKTICMKTTNKIKLQKLLVKKTVDIKKKRNVTISTTTKE